MNLMKANKDPEIQIKDTDRFFYHVEHTRILADPSGKYPEINIRIQIYSKKDYFTNVSSSAINRSKLDQRYSSFFLTLSQEI